MNPTDPWSDFFEGTTAVGGSLDQDRERWIDGVCAGVLGSLGRRGDDLVQLVRDDLGPPRLTAALLTAWIVNCLAGGDSRWRVAGQVAAARVLSLDAATDLEVLHLVDQVEEVLATRGLPVGEPWDPRTCFTFLLETWAVQRRRTVDDGALVGQLRLHWDTTDPRAFSYLLGLRPDPMHGHVTLTERVEADGRELVQAIVA